MTQFILTLNKNATVSDFQSLVAKYSMTVLIDYNALTQVFKIDMDATKKAAVRAEPTVWHVAPADAVVNLMVKVESVSALQNPDITKTTTKISPLANNNQPISVRADGYGGNWGLMRICRKTDWNKKSWYPVTNSYVSYRTGKNSDVYVVDSGINKNHIDFSGRFTVIYDHYRTPTDPTFGQDTLGHGTHVSSCIAGSIHGVAKEAQIYVSRVFDANSASLDAIVAGINACLTHHKNKVQQKINRPSVMNLSLGGEPNITERQLVNACIDAGVVVCAAAGNNGMDLAVDRISPADVVRALTVGATDIQDNITTFSNYGKQIDLFAPGMYITGADWRTVSGENMMSGTSMATPFVAGVVALKMDEGGIGTNGAFVDMINNWIIGVSTMNVVTLTQSAASVGTPNRLLYSYFTTPETAVKVAPVVVKEVSRHTDTNVVSTEKKGIPQVRTTYVDTNSSVVNTDKSTTNTTTREYTDVTYVITTITTTSTPVTTVLYSNNKTDVINSTPVITKTTREDVLSTQKRSVIISQNTIQAPAVSPPVSQQPPVIPPVQVPTPPPVQVPPSQVTKIIKITNEMLVNLLPKYAAIKMGTVWKKIDPQVLISYDSTLNEIELFYVNKYTTNNSVVEEKMIVLINSLIDYANMKGTLRFATYRKISQLKDELKYSLTH